MASRCKGFGELLWFRWAARVRGSVMMRGGSTLVGFADAYGCRNY